METTGFTWHFWCIVAALITIVAWVISSMVRASKRVKKLGVPTQIVKAEDCRVATQMLVDYLWDNIYKQGREDKETSSGCDPLGVLRNSKDIASLIEEVHMCGGRLVVRKVSDSDIECQENTCIKVSQYLSELDMARARRLKIIK